MPKKSTSGQNTSTTQQRSSASGKKSGARGGAGRNRTSNASNTSRSRDASDNFQDDRRGFQSMSADDRERMASGRRDGENGRRNERDQRDYARSDIGRSDDTLWRTESGPRDDRFRQSDDDNRRRASQRGGGENRPWDRPFERETDSQRYGQSNRGSEGGWRGDERSRSGRGYDDRDRPLDYRDREDSRRYEGPGRHEDDRWSQDSGARGAGYRGGQSSSRGERTTPGAGMREDEMRGRWSSTGQNSSRYEERRGEDRPYRYDSDEFERRGMYQGGGGRDERWREDDEFRGPRSRREYDERGYGQGESSQRGQSSMRREY